MSVEVSFPGGKKVDARIGGFVIHSDQSERSGGEASAPEPFDLFLSSIACCAGIYALNFCQSRNLPTTGMALSMDCEREEARKLVSRMTLHLRLPEGFPQRYRGGIVRAMELCTVKRNIKEAPEFTVELI